MKRLAIFGGFLISGSLLLGGCGGPSTVHRSSPITKIQKQVPFPIVLPLWLPKGMHLQTAQVEHAAGPTSVSPADLTQAVLLYRRSGQSGTSWTFTLTEERFTVHVEPHQDVQYGGFTIEQSGIGPGGVGGAVWHGPKGVSYLVTGYDFMPMKVLVHIVASVAKHVSGR